MNLIKFEAPLKKIWKILLYSRLAEDIKIQTKENLIINSEIYNKLVQKNNWYESSDYHYEIYHNCGSE